ncbi:hypothetical protein HanRHA438_Chr01g0038741 [Helianthus annuus]|uniref:Uncharacterized protein n=1 Tax=Helianthus annuus TaxID=4232 RepID=A0A9K3P4C2_HELAN|nr:hypothetical protein HanXRQr2_Chr01g0037791 [Helianthus annuus]KAJ0624290.1 hypothetical protein HanIR_Chr01g0041541 [Helianthus annuus]KAJ0949444.1 hypothetical protein HanRHA438_Chr01g0038741 [Helianthus annuus]KAJ0958193.1 hypothetical protein HanPSC8_Chr01g0036281 [Helianthus annuus]
MIALINWYKTIVIVGLTMVAGEDNVLELPHAQVPKLTNKQSSSSWSNQQSIHEVKKFV